MLSSVCHLVVERLRLVNTGVRLEVVDPGTLKGLLYNETCLEVVNKTLLIVVHLEHVAAVGRPGTFENWFKVVNVVCLEICYLLGDCLIPEVLVLRLHGFGVDLGILDVPGFHV